ncbi:MAG: sigma-70 family RNA polymerase sigma factor [Myxococcales bacterium]|jgi:RNA polymerase sigma-70 factor (ECF subfamily)|nr:sigma-70 family RNA polymerase sigma factor [Myxococcales bacterium]
MSDDLELLAAWRDGNVAAGNQLFRRHFDSIYAFFRGKLGAEAEDLTQDTFHALVRSREAVARAQSFRGYLFATARSKLYDALRRRHGGAKDWDPLTESLAAIEMSPSHAVAARREQQLLIDALRRLPIELQVIVELHYVEQMRGPELAEALDLPEGTVRSRLRRALEQLRERMHELTDDAGLVGTTLSDLSRWAAELRAAGH